MGGKDNCAADRDLADALLKVLPCAALMAQANRDFVSRAITYLAGAGISQFLEVGVSLPVGGRVHEVAQAVLPDARVVCVDGDPTVVARARALTVHTSAVRVLRWDMRDVGGIFDLVAGELLMDLDEPLAVLLAGSLEHSGHAREIVLDLVTELPYGSYLVVSHAEAGSSAVEAAAALCQDRLGSGCPRTGHEIAAMLRRLALVAPGLVRAEAWRAGTIRHDDHLKLPLLAAVGKVMGERGESR